MRETETTVVEEYAEPENAVPASSGTVPAASSPVGSSVESKSVLDTAVAIESLLDRIGIGTSDVRVLSERVEQFLDAKSLKELLTAWFGVLPRSTDEFRRMKRRIAVDIGRIDELLSGQVNVILHHPKFQALESTWRGLHMLWRRRRQLVADESFAGGQMSIELRVLDVSKRDLRKDFDRANEFDRSSLFQMIYENEFGTPGGTPYGSLITAYEFSQHPDDLDLLKNLSRVGAAAFCPVIAGTSPELLGLSDFSLLERPLDLDQHFNSRRAGAWNRLRKHPDSRFLGLTLPRTIMRAPYVDDGFERHGFRFHEDVGKIVDSETREQRSRHLWGPASFAFGDVLLNAFASSGWFADIRGAKRGEASGGLVDSLPAISTRPDTVGVTSRASVDVTIPDAIEAGLCDRGFITLLDCQDTPYSVFSSSSSIHDPEEFNDAVATANARLSSMMQYVMCCSRIAHYLKILVREKIGTFKSPGELQGELTDWVMEYVTGDSRAAPDIKAKHPLRAAEVEVVESATQPGVYNMTFHLLPHYQFDRLSSSVTLVARPVETK